MDENQPGWPPPGIIIPGATMLPGGISGVPIATWGGIPLWVGIAGAGCMGTCGGRLTGCWGMVPCPGMFMGTAPGWGIIANPGGGGGTPGCMGGCGGATCMGGTRMICKKIKPVLLVWIWNISGLKTKMILWLSNTLILWGKNDPFYHTLSKSPK